MIPTTATSSPSTSSSSSSNAASASSSQQNSTTAMIGIASLILEGRAISEDEFQPPQAPPASRPSQFGVIASNLKDLDLFLHSCSSSGGRQSPRPSTSRAAAATTSSTNTSASRHVINITTNPHVFGSATAAAAPSVFDDIFEDPLFAAAESTHQRWTQKLCQLRQASPASTMSRDCGLYEQKVGTDSGEPELVALAINTDAISSADKGDFEIVRRVMLNRSNLCSSSGSTSSSPGSTDNFLHSLQSLATTCLRGGSPAVEAGIRYHGPNTSFGSIGAPKYTMFRSTPPRCSNPFGNDMPGSASSSGSGIQSPMPTWSPSTLNSGASVSGSSSGAGSSNSCNRREKFLRNTMTATTTTSGKIAIPTSSRNAAVSCAAKSSAAASSYPQQGPHCEQFLRKMGLAKGEMADAEDHICDMSYVNITCSRWRAYCHRMETMVSRGEPVCIEVYLGPVGHRILLEQWILTQKEKVPSPTMTLPSLCSAIRSQLYFSQISAWCDLIKKSDSTIYDTGRVIFPVTTGAAGDLATSPGTSPSSPTLHPPNAMPNRRPRLNIFYRIKPNDSTACFNSKPNVHNFPNVIISESCSVSVCLKSLPRINGGIPKLGPATAAPVTSRTIQSESMRAVAGNGTTLGSGPSTSAFAGVVSTPTAAATTPKSSRHTSMAMAATAASPATNCDNNNMSAATASSTFSSTTSLASSGDSSASTPDSQSLGKHKCIFFIDEEELGDEQLNEDDDDCTNGSGAGDSSNSSHLSHREKQLMKYRKRMLKRDKKTTRKLTPEDFHQTDVEQQQQGKQVHKLTEANSNNAQPMEQGEEDHEDIELTEQELYRTQNSRQQQHKPTPYQQYRILSAKSHATSTCSNVAMISTGTQTQATCCQCGTEKALVCLNCDNTFSRKENIDDMDSCSINSTDIIHTPRNKAEMLLQAIQRTPKAARNKKKALRNSPPTTASENCINKNNNHMGIAIAGSGTSSGPAGCQVCKRQKTQHNFGAGSTSGCEGSTEVSEEIVVDEDDDEGDGRVYNETSNRSVTVKSKRQQKQPDTHILEKESFNSSTKLTPHIDKCSLYNNSAARMACTSSSASSDMRMDDVDNTATSRCKRSSCTPPPSNGVSAAALLVHCDSDGSSAATQFKTPTNSQQLQQQQHIYKQTPKPTLLQIPASYHGGGAGDSIYSNGHYEATPSHHNPLLMRKGLPKVNLTPIFCNPTATASVSCLSSSSSSPIPISSCPVLCTDANSFSFDHVAIAATSATAIVDNNNIPVQKSYSAPTLPNSSPSLSPRFAKQAAIYKRRSRHLSDRSDRSSLGSDEQFSDEDLENSMYSPATSPMKMRARGVALFGRRPLLGNLEESLLQKRFVPKMEVVGFKVLLGASGGFCPTQLTIPAAAYFYELHGEALSTPYVCEIRLSRKGYSVPRAGTVQATLLNPMGTVVRMFVIPYDMRDMPPLHQTFIRQRVLAEASTNETIEAVKASINNNNIVTPIGSNNNSVDYFDGSNPQSVLHINGYGGGGVGGSSTDSTNNTTNYNNNNNKYRLSPNGGLHGESNLGHFISTEHMKRLRYSIHLRFQTSRSGRLSLHTDIRLLISRRTDCDTAAAHAKGVLEAPNDLITDTVMPSNPKYSARQENPNKM